jgi:capsid protein
MLLMGAVNLPYASYEKFHQPQWFGRTWQWVDPLKDANAKALMLEKGWTSNSEIVNELGKDLTDIYEQLGKEKTLQEKYGLNFNKTETGSAAPAESDDAANEGAGAGTEPGRAKIISI